MPNGAVPNGALRSHTVSGGAVRIGAARGRGFTAALLLVVGLLVPAWAQALVRESLSWLEYPVRAQANESLMSAIERATRIRQAGRSFHGLTDWHIEWNFQWQQDAGGLCRLIDHTVNLRTTITLPQLTEGTDSQRATFEGYLKALRIHELGHYEIARRTAHDINKALAALAPMRGCEALEQVANRTGYQWLEHARRLGIEYDRQTDHGATQGAKLTR